MAQLRARWRSSRWVWLTPSAAVLAALGVYTSSAPPPKAAEPPAVRGERFVVRRADLPTSFVAAGEVHAARQTTVSCEVDDYSGQGGTLLLSLVPEGQVVRKGDVLCRLDSSKHEELARAQQIEVERARAALRLAELSLATTTAALHEFQGGLYRQKVEESEGRIETLRADAERQAARVSWDEAMFFKQYISKDQLLNDRQRLATLRHDLRTARRALQVYRDHTSRREVAALQSQIDSAESSRRVEAERLRSQEARLAKYRRQVELCTVRAPHDGVVIYTEDEDWPPVPLEPGLRVYKNEALFLLPDLSVVEIEVSVPESLGPRVPVGTAAEVRVEGLKGREFFGRVVKIDTLPLPDPDRWYDDDARRYVARVRLTATDPGMKSRMSAEVVFDTGRAADALVIPVGAMEVVGGRETCAVVSAGGLERRAITTRRANRDLLEVVAGLAEGEHVLVRPGGAVPAAG